MLQILQIFYIFPQSIFKLYWTVHLRTKKTIYYYWFEMVWVTKSNFVSSQPFSQENLPTLQWRRKNREERRWFSFSFLFLFCKSFFLLLSNTFQTSRRLQRQEGGESNLFYRVGVYALDSFWLKKNESILSSVSCRKSIYYFCWYFAFYSFYLLSLLNYYHLQMLKNVDFFITFPIQKYAAKNVWMNYFIFATSSISSHFSKLGNL